MRRLATIRLATGILAVSSGVVGCGGVGPTTPPGYSFPINRLSADSSGGPAAALTGVLRVEGPCLYVDSATDPMESYLIGWPETSRLSNDDGTLVVLENDVEVAQPGGTVWIEGGAYRSAEDMAFARSKLEPPTSCLGPIWLGLTVKSEPPG